MTKRGAATGKDRPEVVKPHKEPPLTGRHRAEETLHKELDRIGWALYCKEMDAQSAALKSLRILGGFLYVRSVSGIGMKSVQILIEAIEDVRRGTLPEIFDPNWRGQSGDDHRKRSRSSAKREVKIYAAAVMGALMKTEMAKSDAAKRVARAATKWTRVDQQIINARTVTGWRDDCLQAMATDSDRQKYEYRVELMTDGSDGKLFRDYVLKNGPPLLASPQAIENTE